MRDVRLFQPIWGRRCAAATKAQLDQLDRWQKNSLRRTGITILLDRRNFSVPV